LLMVGIGKYDFYEALSSTDWKSGLELRKEVIQAKGFKDPDEVENFFKKAYWATRTPSLARAHVYLHELVTDGWAETQIRLPTDQELAQYASFTLPRDYSHLAGECTYRKLPTGRGRSRVGRGPGLDSLVPHDVFR